MQNDKLPQFTSIFPQQNHYKTRNVQIPGIKGQVPGWPKLSFLQIKVMKLKEQEHNSGKNEERVMDMDGGAGLVSIKQSYFLNTAQKGSILGPLCKRENK